MKTRSVRSWKGEVSVFCISHMQLNNHICWNIHCTSACYAFHCVSGLPQSLPWPGACYILPAICPSLACTEHRRPMISGGGGRVASLPGCNSSDVSAFCGRHAWENTSAVLREGHLFGYCKKTHTHLRKYSAPEEGARPLINSKI